MLDLNRNIAKVGPSASVELMGLANRLIKEGADIVNLAGGEPDFDTPRPIVDEAIKQLNAGYTHYTTGAGLPELRARIAEKLQKENGISARPEEIIVTAGAKLAIYYAVRAAINEGDDVMVLNPGWVSYNAIIECAGGRPLPVELKAMDGMHVQADALEQAWTGRTRLLIINYPNNPTGVVLEPADLDVLVSFMKKHPDVLLLSDEIYERIVFDGKENLSPASVPEIAARVITVNGFSKSVAMTGWRIGYLHAPAPIVKVIAKIYTHTLTCVSGFIQKAAVRAFDCADEIERMRATYQARRDLFVGGLNEIPHITAIRPGGAFYAWARFDLPQSGMEIADFLLKEYGVVGVPGAAYGLGGEKCVRFSFATSDAVLREGLVRICAAVDALSR